MGLGLAPEEVMSLETRTEGWIAGLQLAAISLAEMPEGEAETELSTAARRSAFLRSFAGDDRYVMDYLMDEVLSREGEAVQGFLLRTAVLKRLCGTLCDTLLAEEAPPEGSQAILERLERANLFLIPLDNRRQWYRYHHLFGDLLLGRLQTRARQEIPTLHGRASCWFEQEGAIPA